MKSSKFINASIKSQQCFASQQANYKMTKENTWRIGIFIAFRICSWAITAARIHLTTPLWLCDLLGGAADGRRHCQQWRRRQHRSTATLPCPRVHVTKVSVLHRRPQVAALLVTGRHSESNSHAWPTGWCWHNWRGRGLTRGRISGRRRRRRWWRSTYLCVDRKAAGRA